MSRNGNSNNALFAAASNRVPNTLKRCYCDNGDKSNGDRERLEQDSDKVESAVRVTFVDKDNNRFSVDGKVGENLLYLAHRCNIAMEGACEASLACTTCHCYVHFDYVSKLPEASEQEEDLLDMAPFLQENSRLGCQIILTHHLDGLQVTLPKATRNFYVDGHKPKPH